MNDQERALRIAAIQERLKKRTQGAWQYTITPKDGGLGEHHHIIETVEDEIQLCGDVLSRAPDYPDPDFLLMVNAPDDLQFLLDELERTTGFITFEGELSPEQATRIRAEWERIYHQAEDPEALEIIRSHSAEKQEYAAKHLEAHRVASSPQESLDEEG